MSISTSLRARVFMRGGPRPRIGKISHTLTTDQVTKVSIAIQTAYDRGLPLNRLITIHWERAGVAEHLAVNATCRFLKFARDNLGSKRLHFAYVWVRENDDGNGKKGHHVHILAHVPNGHSLGRWQRKWITSITGKPYKKNVIKTAVVARHSQASQTSPEFYLFNLAEVGAYILKGASHEAATAFSLHKWELGGRVVGKRFGMSKNLT